MHSELQSITQTINTLRTFQGGEEACRMRSRPGEDYGQGNDWCIPCTPCWPGVMILLRGICVDKRAC